MNAYQIDGGYLVNGPSFHQGYLMDGVWDLRDYPLVDESQVDGNIENCGDDDSDDDDNRYSKLQSYDLVSCSSNNDIHTLYFIEGIQGMCMPLLCLIETHAIEMLGAGASGDIAAFGVKAKYDTISENKVFILHISVHVN